MADVKFKRLDTANRILEAVEDGKYILDYQKPSIYLDEGTTRIELTPRDTALSTTSTNPIENQALTNSIINTLAEALAITADAIPCGTNPLKELNIIVSNLITSITPVSVWTNPSPTATFTAKTVTLSQSAANFTKAEVIFKVNNGLEEYSTTGVLDIALIKTLRAPFFIGNLRSVSISGTSAVFGSGYTYNTYSNGTGTQADGYCVPYKIIFYK